MFAAAFIDKDGTLVEDIPFNVDPRKIRLTKGAVKGLRSLHAAGFRVIVITNQPGVAHGLFPEETLREVEANIRSVMADLGVPLEGFYYCPHATDGTVPEFAVPCSCRKPQPGMIVRACEEHDIDPARSWFVGDILDDVESAHRAGVRAVLLDCGNETEWNFSPLRVPDQVADSLEEAARHIVTAKESGAAAPAAETAAVPEPASEATPVAAGAEEATSDLDQ